MVEPTSLLLGLEGLGVSAVVQRADRTRVVEVITVDPNASRCPACGMASDSVKERTVTSPRDVRYGDDRGSPFRSGPINSLCDLEDMTSAWASWYNASASYTASGAVPPAEAEAELYAQLQAGEHIGHT